MTCAIITWSVACIYDMIMHNVYKYFSIIHSVRHWTEQYYVYLWFSTIYVKSNEIASVWFSLEMLHASKNWLCEIYMNILL